MTTFSYLTPDTSHPGWQALLSSPELATQLQAIDRQLAERAAAGETIYPPRSAVFEALRYCAPQQVKVVILGQDPYHGAGEAMGLSFSVPAGVRVPPSLRNIYKELASDLDIAPAAHGDLRHWAQQGVLLLNSVFTVAADNAGSHGKLGWQAISDALIEEVSRSNPGCVFVLWGNWAQTKRALIDETRHRVIASAHPSPLAARRGFFGSRPFSACNAWLSANGHAPIDWALATPQAALGF